MIRLIEASNYKCLKHISQELKKFQILVGPNASGKTTFLDVVSFISDIVNHGVDFAVTSRASHFDELTFGGKGGSLELAIEAELPESIRSRFHDREYNVLRYEIRIGMNEELKEFEIDEERMLLLKRGLNMIVADKESFQQEIFPMFHSLSNSILNQKYKKDSYRLVMRKKPKGNDNYYSETTVRYNKGSRLPPFKLGPKKSALGNLPADESRFPASTWLKEYLNAGIQSFILDSLNIRKASPPAQSLKFKPDGSNLPWVIDRLKKNKDRFRRWIEHVRTALPDVISIDTVERADDKHRYLKMMYENDISVPSWLVSDGTLRLLALTIPAYLPEFTGTYMVEEPENGIHPKALETVYQSLSSIYNAQILLATHSPIIIGLVKSSDILCFAKTEEGITDIIEGDKHPALRNWQGDTNLSDLYAGGVLG